MLNVTGRSNSTTKRSVMAQSWTDGPSGTGTCTSRRMRASGPSTTWRMWSHDQW